MAKKILLNLMYTDLTVLVEDISSEAMRKQVYMPVTLQATSSFYLLIWSVFLRHTQEYFSYTMVATIMVVGN